MGLKKVQVSKGDKNFYVSNGCKKIFYVSNGCKKILGIKWEQKNLGVKLLKKTQVQVRVKKF